MAWEDRPYYRNDERPRLRFAIPMPTPLAMALMGACLAVFLILNVFGVRDVARWGILSFLNGLWYEQPWRWFTYAYIHGGGAHIFGNLLGLYFFLPPLEQAWGWKRTFAFYTLGTIAAGLTFGIMCLFIPYPGLMGASGGVLAVIGACAYLFPEMSIFGIIPIRILALLYAILYVLTIAGDKNASDAAHLGGLAFGWFAPYYGRHAWGALAQRFEQTKARRSVRAVKEEQEEQVVIDRILQKVHDRGMNSLSWGERRALKKATERQRIRDAARARRAVR
jgi:membrane associated rhomboid family serine protease